PNRTLLAQLRMPRLDYQTMVERAVKHSERGADAGNGDVPACLQSLCSDRALGRTLAADAPDSGIHLYLALHGRSAGGDGPSLGFVVSIARALHGDLATRLPRPERLLWSPAES